MRPPSAVYFFGVFRNSTISLELLLGFVDACDVGKAHLDVVFGKHAVLAARERHDAAFGAAHAAHEEAPEHEQQQDWDDPADDFRQPPADLLAGVLDARGIEFFDQLGILNSGGVEVAAAVDVGFEGAANGLLSRP